MRQKIKKYFPDNRILFFIGVLSVFAAVFWVAAVITDWTSTKTSIFRWEHWFFEDWFGELHRFQTGIYTGDDIANYPAFCFLIFKVFYAFLPKPEGLIYDDLNIRATQAAAVPFCIFMVILIYCLYHIFRRLMRDKTSWEREGMALAMLASAPFVYVFERGNLIIIALICTFLYLMMYDSDKGWVRFMSYVCLSVAAAVKLYPAFFGVLTLMKKRYRETALLVVMGAATFVLPFFAFGGFKSILAFFNAIFGSFATYYDYGFGYDFSIYNLERLIRSLLYGYQTEASNISRLVVVVCLAVSFFCTKETWKKLCVISLGIILLPTFSYFYAVCFLAIPLLYMLRSPEKRIHYLYMTEFLLIYVPYLHFPIDKINFMTGEEASHIIGAGHFIMYAGILSMLLTLLIDGICQRAASRGKRRRARAGHLLQTD